MAHCLLGEFKLRRFLAFQSSAGVQIIRIGSMYPVAFHPVEG